MTENDIQDALAGIQKQLDEMLRILQGIEGKKRARADAKRAQRKMTDLTPIQISELKAKFESLYERWLSGQETHIQGELEAMDAEQLRTLADANNLNVTSKTPKPKCIHLIGARFREKKQLTSGLSGLISTQRDTQP